MYSNNICSFLCLGRLYNKALQRNDNGLWRHSLLYFRIKSFKNWKHFILISQSQWEAQKFSVLGDCLIKRLLCANQCEMFAKQGGIVHV